VAVNSDYDWIECPALGEPSIWVKGNCPHRRTESVVTLDGEYAARLCLTCDAQLPPFDLDDWMTMEGIR